MTVDSVPFMVCVAEPLQMTFVEEVPAKTALQYSRVLTKFISCYSKKGITCTLVSDAERALSSAYAMLEGRVKIEISGTGSHAPVVERKIRTIKERVRGILNRLPYRLPLTLLKHLVYHAVNRINMIPTLSGSEFFQDQTSPREKYFQRKTDFNTDLRHSFGEYVQIRDNKAIENSTASRTLGAIALNQSNSQTGSVYFYCLATDRVVERQSWIPLPISAEGILYMNQLADRKKHVREDPFDESDERVLPTEDELDLRGCTMVAPDAEPTADDTELAAEAVAAIHLRILQSTGLA